MKTDLSQYDNSWYKPGSKLRRILWYFSSALFFHSKLFPFSTFLKFVLKLFGAKIAKGVVIRPGVQIKYPWFLSVEENAWIGEDVWIDNLAMVEIGANAVLSQGAMLECGNHDYCKPSFDLIVAPIKIEDGVWIGAKSFVGPGTVCKSHAVLAAYSRAPKELDAYSVYSGVPATKIKERSLS